MELLEEDKEKFYSEFFKHDLYFVTKKGRKLLKKHIKYDPFEEIEIDFGLAPYCEKYWFDTQYLSTYNLFERCVHYYRNGLNTHLLAIWIKEYPERIDIKYPYYSSNLFFYTGSCMSCENGDICNDVHIHWIPGSNDVHTHWIPGTLLNLFVKLGDIEMIQLLIDVFGQDVLNQIQQ